MIMSEPYTPTHLQRWHRPDSYIGEQFDEYFVVIGRSRDSNLVSQSNFASALKMLGGESDTVIVHRASHWLNGWVEIILVHESDVAHLAIGDTIRNSLVEYPVLDDDDLDARETAAAADVMNDIREHPDWYPDAPTDEEKLSEYVKDIIYDNWW
jgi:hypothetical protein